MSMSPRLHQNHDYNHVPGGADQVWRGKESERNFQFCGGVKHSYTLLDVFTDLECRNRFWHGERQDMSSVERLAVVTEAGKLL